MTISHLAINIAIQKDLSAPKNMKLYQTKSLERNSRLSVALVRNRGEQNNLDQELGHLEREKKTALRMLQNDKNSFKLRYSKSNTIDESSYKYITDETVCKYLVPPLDMHEKLPISTQLGDSGARASTVDFQEIHNMLFTDNEIDKEKILCLHLVSAHRTECLTPPKKKIAHMCKIHSPLERLLERSKRKHIHMEQKMTNMLPIYTLGSMQYIWGVEETRIDLHDVDPLAAFYHALAVFSSMIDLELTEFGPRVVDKNPINDGRLATRILLNEKVRELINSVLSALRQSNPEKNYEIFEMANDASCLKKLFTKQKITNFLDELMDSALINSCESFILTAPFRVKSIQLEIRTIAGTLETLLKQVRQNVLQLPTRSELKYEEDEALIRNASSTNDAVGTPSGGGRMFKNKFSDQNLSVGRTKALEQFYADKLASYPTDKKIGRHTDKNFVRRNIDAAANVRRIEYDTDDSEDFYQRPRRSSQSSSTRSRRRSSDQTSSGNLLDRPNIQPLKIPEEVVAIMGADDEDLTRPSSDAPKSRIEEKQESNNNRDSVVMRQDSRTSGKRLSGDPIRAHLKQTTCPACMERYKIPLPTPKTPRVKPSSVIPLAPGENASLKTNSQHRISMLINKEMFKLQSYERRFSSEESSRRNSLKRKEIETCSSSYLNLSPLELAKIEQEVKEMETKKKLDKFLTE